MNEPATELSFEASLVQLEQTVRDLEDGQLGLEDALGRYEQGVSLIKRCYARLREIEVRVLQLTGMNDQGQPVLQPFKHEATAAKNGDVPARRATRRRVDELD